MYDQEGQGLEKGRIKKWKGTNFPQSEVQTKQLPGSEKDSLNE